MRWNLLPREPYFFEAFARMTEELRVGAQLLVELLSTHPVRRELVDRIHEVEHACDVITHEILHRLNSTFVTPIDREDVHELATKFDDVMDAIDDASQRVPLHRIEHLREGAVALAQVVLQQCEQLVLAAKQLPTMRGIPDRVHAITQLEKEADRVHHQAVGLLFDNERDPIEVIKWKEIFDFLEDAADRAEDVAGVLESIAIKQG